ncbi:MAG: hypothetical protein KC418_04695 [Anaerolineales bacterium]|nr:hypothetical protein [Anaerolineales bacterium]MCB8952217.1 hypothetical protein [Ardenticatenales bacterium]
MNHPDRPSHDQWWQLLELARQLKALSPWQWMYEDQIFGVEDPETGEINYASIMGMLGEHCAIGFYLGEEALSRYVFMQENQEQVTPEFLLNTRQLQLSFEDRNMLRPDDYRVIKESGLKFRGRGAWPLFRSFMAGYAPWRLTADEARFMIHALPQVIDVTERVRANPDWLGRFDEAAARLIRVPEATGDGWLWRDDWQQMAVFAPPARYAYLDEALLAHCKNLPVRRKKVEIDFFWLPMGLQDNEDERPCYPYMLLCVDAGSGIILGNSMMTIKTTWPDLLADIPNQLMHMFGRLNELPREIRLASPLIHEYLVLLQEYLPLRLKVVPSLPGLDMARDYLFEMM